MEVIFSPFGGGMPRGTFNTLLDMLQPSQLKSIKDAGNPPITNSIGGEVSSLSPPLRFIPTAWKPTVSQSLTLSSFLIPRWSTNLRCFTGLNFMATINLPVLCRSAHDTFRQPFVISDRIVLSTYFYGL